MLAAGTLPPSPAPTSAAVVPIRPRIGDYEVIAQIGSGGMGVVYLTRRRRVAAFERRFAVKVLPSRVERRQEATGMLFDEALVASRIYHANVVSAVDAGYSEAGPYIAMDYVHGPNLGQMLRSAARRGMQLARNVSVRIVGDVLAGLAAAHELAGPDGRSLGIVHRDISPGNILVGADGLTRVADFGIVRARERLTETSPGIIKGKLAYAAPEQLGERVVDRRADVFAAGVVLWEVLAGERLFHGDLAAQRPAGDKDADLPSLTSYDRVLEPFDAVVARALAATPERRYASAVDMARDVERAARRTGCATSRQVSLAVSVYAADWLRERAHVLTHG